MPHVVVEGAGDLEGLYKAFTPIVQRSGTEILKIQEFYLARSGREALLESVAIEQGAARNFFVQLKQHGATITVRLLPATDPEKTPAVKKVMAWWRDSSERGTRLVVMERLIFKSTWK